MSTITKTTPATTTQAEAKVAGIKAAGMIFAQERSAKYGGGLTGNKIQVLPELSGHNKVQGEVTCLKCEGTHVREASDWHQSLFCRNCKPTAQEKKAAAPTPGAGNGGVGGRKVTLPDGTVLREFSVGASDDAETKQLKEESNALFAQLWAEEQAKKDAEKAAKAQEAEKAKLMASKTKMEEVRAAMKARLERVKEYAAKTGLAVSPQTAQEALDAEIAQEEQKAE